MENTLILLLGNRDIQVLSQKFEEIKGKYVNFFLLNNDDRNFHIIDKFNTNKHNQSFLSISKMIWEDYDYMKDYISYELFRKSMEILQDKNIKIDKVFITTSAQESLHDQDCLYVAKCFEQYLSSQNINFETRLCSVNPTDFEQMFGFYTNLFNEVRAQSEKVYVSNSGGTPQMRTASHFAGLFKGFEYIAVSSSDKNSSQIYVQQERLILKSIIENMLNVYDYEGIRNLPIDDEIRSKCNEALEKYNFSKLSDTPIGNNYEAKVKIALPLLYSNMVISFKQGRYADVLGRLFRLEEALGHYIQFIEFKSNENIRTTNSNMSFRYNNNTQQYNFEQYFESKAAQIQLLSTYYPSHFNEATVRNRADWYFTQFSSVPLASGKSFWYFFSKSLGKFDTIADFFAQINNQYRHGANPLGNLRNKSILGHGYEGVSKQDIENIIGNFDKFQTQLKQLLTENLDFVFDDVFDKINEEIRELLK